jgi:hypothetical protein
MTHPKTESPNENESVNVNVLLSSSSSSTSKKDEIPVISDSVTLLKYGIYKVALPKDFDSAKWARELAQITPDILLGQGDNEYSFYRNILEEPDFPFDSIMFESEMGRGILTHFPVQNLRDELQLDDAFCVHYNMDQDDTSGAKHMDPSDITINMCLENSDETKGSHVLFYGTKQLENDNNKMTTTTTRDNVCPPERFLVLQEPGYATIHFGDHSHETTSLEKGRRTNIIMTYIYTDPTRSDVATRACY